MSDSPKPGTASRPFAIVVGALVVAALVAVFVVRVGSGHEPPPPDPTIAYVEIRSSPPHATVSFSDGGVLGTTPFVAELPKGPSEVVVTVKLEGYYDHRVSVPLFSANGRIDTRLTKIGEDAAAPPPPPPDGWSP